jgi:hypothetical protein
MMKNHQVITLTAVVLLSTFCLVANLRAADADGVMMQDGKMMMMKNGKATGAMQDSMAMPNGARVMSDGTVKMKDGSECT